MRIEDTYQGFRESLVDYETLTRQVKAWAETFPDVAHLRTLGQTPEGRELWLLTLGPDPERARPTVWVDANMHACEMCGTSVALAIAEDVIRLHTDGLGESAPSKAVTERLRDVRFFIMPRMSPDGAEAVLQTGRFVRSVPRDVRDADSRPRFITGDVDGDGLALSMRKQDPTGEYVESSVEPGLMVPRGVDDEGPFFKIWPEGTIANYDGVSVPDPFYLGDNEPDLNRNFPYHWAPEPKQAGAGRFPLSEPESRAVVEFTSAHPEIFVWLNLHTFGGVFIRPLGDKPDTKMSPGDLAIWREIGHWAEEITGYPMVSGCEEFTYEPDTPLHGDLTDYAYHQRGAVAYVCELWDIFAQLGKERPKRFVDYYTNFTREDCEALAKWDREHNASRIIRPWKAVTHPQLGEVEVGGVDTRVGLWNPPPDKMPKVCADQSTHLLRVASLVPRVELDVSVTAIDGGATRVVVAVANHGYLSTSGLSAFDKIGHNEALYADIEVEGCQLVDEGPRKALGHLAGWGRGRFDGSAALYDQQSRGTRGSAQVAYTLTGKGSVKVRVGSCRVGFQEVSVDVG